MREIRTSGSEGGTGVIPPFLPLSSHNTDTTLEGPRPASVNPAKREKTGPCGPPPMEVSPLFEPARSAGRGRDE